MAEDYVDPVGAIPGGGAIEGQGRRESIPVAHRAVARGEVVSVRHPSGAPGEPHTFDATVGGHEQTEIVIRVESGDVRGLLGKEVVVHLKP